MTGTVDSSVAVVIPVWDDYVRWLEEAVDSVVDQGVADQVIVVDNASAVPVPELPGTTLVRAATRLTTGAARNLGLEQVCTSLVVFLDADDVMLPESLRLLTQAIVARPDAVAVGMDRVEADTGQRHRAPRPIAARLARHPRVFAIANSVWSLVPTQGTMVMRTDLVRAAGGYGDRSQGEDWVLGASLAWRGPIVLENHLVLLYRWRGDSPGQLAAHPPLAENAHSVLQRLRGDDALPCWGHRALSLIAVGQLVAIRLVRPAFRVLRGFARRG